LLGKHRFNGVVSDEDYQTENRSWRMYAHSREWAGYWNRNDGSTSDFRDRPPVGVIYLGSSLANATSASGANIPNISSSMGLTNGSVYHFASTWTNPAGVAFGDPYAVPTNLTIDAGRRHRRPPRCRIPPTTWAGTRTSRTTCCATTTERT
jgi:hypothetical protein